ncbi:exodeoxyribonuclease VII small subunit [Pacificimonas flava]|uniref:Exodeoxyribonuclease 7 small subunit n=2 Tax=Pacificimonas TaxID=1960290 RepID=A0A219B493_9SPHN|nr:MULTISPECIES: exodeoxyribonuclease VII small subunit [Pacificimonas]MBZ6377187.1 exodeoxyribonuclease VII small subunit [Pacificimonas aurantium]OWV33091.1 exodeoxyribonuclease VII small subunit [Pacificimonas flava]
MQESAPPEEEPGFEVAMRRLEEIVQKLERGEESLEESLALYEEGSRLKKICEEKLAAARVRVEKMRLGPRGEPEGTEPLDTADR